MPFHLVNIYFQIVGKDPWLLEGYTPITGSGLDMSKMKKVLPDPNKLINIYKIP